MSEHEARRLLEEARQMVRLGDLAYPREQTWHAAVAAYLATPAPAADAWEPEPDKRWLCEGGDGRCEVKVAWHRIGARAGDGDGPAWLCDEHYRSVVAPALAADDDAEALAEAVEDKE